MKLIDIFGSHNQGGGLGKIWKGRKLREEFLKMTQIYSSILL
jgi:hypothetical protein